jgi:ABC-type oligopeptide transport system ATPase subunit
MFQKEQLYVRANEDITIDIYEGETLGIVGESGCGKSTLGRVLLQLYPQTAGTTIYYGSTLADTAPAYVEDTLKNLDKYKQKLQKAEAARLAAEKAAAVREYNAKHGVVEEEAPRNEALSGIPERPYCKGRAYDPNRYNR